MTRSFFAALALASLTTALAAQPIVSWSHENMRLRSASVTPAAGGWSLTLVADDDNGDPSLPNSFRRWWHCQVDHLDPAGTRLDIRVTNTGYRDVILPVWSLSTDGGATFGTWSRMPTSATPVTSGSSSAGTAVHAFTVSTPPGVDSIRIAKWFPYTLADKAALLATLQADPSGRVRGITSIGDSWQGRPIELVELTEPSLPDTGKQRIWIHSAVHPSENTAYFMVEGLLAFLLSNDPDAAALLRGAIVDVVPMANPDGVVLGNYRTNSRSDEIEDNWAAPYADPEREVVALRTAIEGFMGTAAMPGSNPIELILNLHSSHGDSHPFHFRHTSNPSFDLITDRTGVVPSVHALENAWIQALFARSPFVASGSTQSSSCGAPVRPFVECMMHDRWSIDPAWTAHHAQIMAITLEGTYTRGDGTRWSTPDHYRDAGAAIGRALVDYFGFPPAPDLTASLSLLGSPCNGLIFNGAIQHTFPDRNVADLFVAAATPGAAGLLTLGFGTRVLAPLPPPFACDFMPGFVASAPLVLQPVVTRMSFVVPTAPGFVADLHVLTVLASGPSLLMQSSQIVELANDF